MLNKLIDEKNRAFKNKNHLKSVLLGTVISDAQKILKDSGKISDSEIQDIIFKFVKGIEENIKLTTDLERVARYHEELTILNEYLPSKLSTEQLTLIIQEIILGGNNNLGSIMKVLSSKYRTLYNGKQASDIIKCLLN